MMNVSSVGKPPFISLKSRPLFQTESKVFFFGSSRAAPTLVAVEVSEDVRREGVDCVDC